MCVVYLHVKNLWNINLVSIEALELYTNHYNYVDSVNRYTDGYLLHCAYTNLMSTGWQKIDWQY